MALQRTKSGKVDKRTKEYKEMVANLAKARAVKKRNAQNGKSFLVRLMEAFS